MHPSQLPGNTDYPEINTERLHAQNAEQPAEDKLHQQNCGSEYRLEFLLFWSSSVLERNVIIEGLPGGGGGGGPCSLVPFQNRPMFPCSYTLSECFRTVTFRILFPCSQKLAKFPCSLRYFANVPLFPKNPFETLIISNNFSGLKKDIGNIKSPII